MKATNAGRERKIQLNIIDFSIQSILKDTGRITLREEGTTMEQSERSTGQKEISGKKKKHRTGQKECSRDRRKSVGNNNDTTLSRIMQTLSRIQQTLSRIMQGPLVCGSVTVETSLIMSVILLVILSSLYLTMHVHNGTCMTASCIEQAISGRQQSIPPLFFAGNVECGEEESSSQRTVSMSSATFYFSGQFLWQDSSKRTYKKYYPVTYLRKIRGAGKLVTGE